jgi:hypothetical protein
MLHIDLRQILVLPSGRCRLANEKSRARMAPNDVGHSTITRLQVTRWTEALLHPNSVGQKWDKRAKLPETEGIQGGVDTETSHATSIT